MAPSMLDMNEDDADIMLHVEARAGGRTRDVCLGKLHSWSPISLDGRQRWTSDTRRSLLPVYRRKTLVNTTECNENLLGVEGWISDTFRCRSKSPDRLACASLARLDGPFACTYMYLTAVLYTILLTMSECFSPCVQQTQTTPASINSRRSMELVMMAVVEAETADGLESSSDEITAFTSRFLILGHNRKNLSIVSSQGHQPIPTRLQTNTQ
jgi:hypothetical protein